MKTDKMKVAEEYSSRVQIYNVGSLATRTEGEGKLRMLISKGDVVVDVGCGPGFALPVVLHRIGRNGFAVALDISIHMLKEARRCLESWEFPSRKFDRSRSRIRGLEEGPGPDARAFFVLGDGERLPFRDDRIDVAFSFTTLHRMDPEIGMTEMWRVIKPGGYMFVQIPAAQDEDAMVFEHVPPSYLPGKVPKGFPPDFKLDPEYWREEQSSWGEFKAFCRRRIPWLAEAIRSGWFNGYEDLRKEYNEYKQGKTGLRELETFIESWERRNDAGKLEWICFPTRRYFSTVLGKLEDAGAIVVECYTGSLQPDVVRLSKSQKRYFEFYVYTYSQILRSHVAVLAKPLWVAGKASTGNPGSQHKL